MPNVIKSVANLFLNAFVAWLAGLVFISATLYFSNSGADFTITDIMGFGVMAIVASGMLMLLVYLPSLYWLKRRSRGVSAAPLSTAHRNHLQPTCIHNSRAADKSKDGGV